MVRGPQFEKRCFRRTDWWVLCTEMMAIHLESYKTYKYAVMSVAAHMQTTMVKGSIFKYTVPSFMLLYEAHEIFLDALNQGETGEIGGTS